MDTTMPLDPLLMVALIMGGSEICRGVDPMTLEGENNDSFAIQRKRIVYVIEVYVSILYPRPVKRERTLYSLCAPREFRNQTVCSLHAERQSIIR